MTETLRVYVYGHGDRDAEPETFVLHEFQARPALNITNVTQMQ
jgi:hypothetical protein